MNDDQVSRNFQEKVSVYADRVQKAMRLFGIELTKDDVVAMVQEELMNAQREMLRKLFLGHLMREA